MTIAIVIGHIGIIILFCIKAHNHGYDKGYRAGKEAAANGIWKELKL